MAYRPVVRLEPYDPAKHDPACVAGLIYDADPEFNAFIFGPRDVAIGFLRNLMNTPGTYYAAPRLFCILSDANLVGIVSGYPAKFQSTYERLTGKAFVRSFGLCGFLRRLPVLLKMRKILSGTMEKAGYYIVYLSIKASERGKGHGTVAVKTLSSDWPVLYLHVAADNASAIRFYEKNRFVARAKRTGTIKKIAVGAVFMERRSERP